VRRHDRKTFALVALAGYLTVTSAGAQPYPAKPVRLLVTSTAGGSVDTVARTIGTKLGDRLGQQVIVDNRPGAGGAIAASTLVRSPADGYTLILGTAPMLALNPSLYKSLPYDPARDFAPISLMATQDLILLIHPSIPARSVKDLVAIARRKPGQLSYASAGNGTAGHLSGELLKKLAGIDLLHVPYKGVSSLLIDVASGEVSMTFASLLAGHPFVVSGKLRALAVTGTRRSPKVPELPTMMEAGIQGYESSTWYGMLAPARTPPEIVVRLNSEILAVLKQPETIDRLAKEGIYTVGTSAQQFAAFIVAEIEKWRRVIKAAKVEPI
jgi:tripartite-type tricarboxylate transporter receptor subunit TctC